MNSSKENIHINPEALPALRSHQDQILATLSGLRSDEPNNTLVQDVENLGGIGNLGLSLDEVLRVLEENAEISVSSANFVVAYLNTPTIKAHIAKQCGEKVSIADINRIRDRFMDFL